MLAEELGFELALFFSCFSCSVEELVSGMVAGLFDDLFDATRGPVDDRTEVSAFSADLALATIPLLNDVFTWNGLEKKCS